MQINYYFHTEIEAEEKELAKKYLEEKAVNWEKFFKGTKFPARAVFEMEFMIRKKHYRTELRLESSLGRFIAVAKKHTPQEGIDAVADEIKRQIGRQKDKLITLKRRSATSIKKKFTIHNGARFR